MSRFMSRFVVFSTCKNPIFQIQGSSRVRPNFADGAEPGQADRARPNPRPAQPVIFTNHGPKSDPVCDYLTILFRPGCAI